MTDFVPLMICRWVDKADVDYDEKTGGLCDFKVSHSHGLDKISLTRLILGSYPERRFGKAEQPGSAYSEALFKDLGDDLGDLTHLLSDEEIPF